MNPELADLLVLTVVGVAAGLFWRGRRVHETTVRVTRHHCQREEVLLLDETVALRKIRLRRDHRGRWRLWRLYTFEFTVTGGERYSGETRVIGDQVENITLPPHRFFREPDQLH